MQNFLGLVEAYGLAPIDYELQLSLELHEKYDD
jgi:hypothetical protein